ncbi:peptide MFS transporter [Oleiharenicola lentus]|uniref:peptide MFS transporter n=1 Tax=Oleiharenicola lentus TaxID=2508720 RepID=UPI003F67AB01
MNPKSAPVAEMPVPVEMDTGGLGGHPRGLTTLFVTEMWERFSYYGMRALLVLFMTLGIAEGGLGFSDKNAFAVYSTYTMSVYLLSILGGYIADNFIGARRAVLWGGTIIALGHFSMALHSQITFFAGLALVALGTGLLKPNISTMVGSLYSPTDERRDAGFSIFYMGINIGALAASIVCGWLAQSEQFKGILANFGLDARNSWHWAFGAAGVGMTLGLIAYIRRSATVAHVGHAPALEGAGRPWGKLSLVVAGSLALIGVMIAADHYRWIVYALFISQIALILFFAVRPSTESRRIAAILVFFLAAQIFWAIFEQAGSSVSLFADRLTDNRIFGWEFPSAWWQSVNSAWVIILAPIFAWLWTKLGSKQPSSPTKFALGLFFVALSFVWMIPAARLTAEGRISPIWLLGLYFFQTVGEMCLSPVGLSTMTKLAPARLLGLVMGIWFLAAALGNKLAGVLATGFNSEDAPALAKFFSNQAILVGVATLALFALVPWVKRLMGGVR